MRPAEVVVDDKEAGVIAAAGGGGGRGRNISRDMALPSPEALMAIEPQHRRRSLHRIEDEDGQDELSAEAASHRVVVVPPSPQKMRRSGSGRPKSYVQILEDFQEHQRNLEQQQHGEGNNVSGGDAGAAQAQPLPVGRSTSGTTQETGFTISTAALTGNESAVSLTSEQNTDSADGSTPQSGINGDGVDDKGDDGPRASLGPIQAKEATARRHKRFSLPAVAVQTAAVTTRPNVTGEGKSKRFSLVLGAHLRRNTAPRDGTAEAGSTIGPNDGRGDGGQAKSGAAGRLSELLASSRAKVR
jgi:FYVE, RhoGEF and PH domain containing 5/6